MKKLTSFILIVLLFLFAACSSAEAGRVDRWNNETDIKFSIRLLKGATKDADGTVTEDAEEGFFDYSENPGTQIKPDFVSGEYSYSIKYTDGKWLLEQSTTVNETFNKERVDIFKTNSWKSEADKNGIVYSENETGVTVTSTTKSTVEFNLFANSGGAVSSSKTVKGVFVYIAQEGAETKHEIWFNNYTVDVKYSGKNAETTFTDRIGNWDMPAEKTVSVPENVYDNETFIFAVRALNLGKLVSSSETFNSYNGIEHVSQTISVQAVEREEGKIYLAAVGPQNQGYQYLLYFENSTAAEKMIRPVNSVGGKVQSFDLLKFSQGYMMFERIK